MTRAVAIVPARNEAARIEATVRALLSSAQIEEVVVVDDGSSDATSAIALDAGARVIRAPSSRGKGAALAAGCARTDAEFLAFIDADLGDTASVGAALLAVVTAGSADMAIAAPPPSGPSGFGVVERLARTGIARLAGVQMARPLSGQRALRRAVVERCGLAGRFGVEVALTIDAVRAGFRIVEVPLALDHARTGRDLPGFIHRARQGLDVGRVLASRSARRR